MGRVVYGYWDCPYCGNAGIRGDKRECPGCGRPRDDNTQFYMQKGKREYVPKEKVNRSPDWACEFCNSLNPASATVCESCGSPKGSKPKTYFDMQRKREEHRKPRDITPVNDGFEWDPLGNPDMERAGSDEFEGLFEPDFGPGKPADYRGKETTIGQHADTSDESSQTGLSGIGQNITKVAKATIKAVGNFFANHGVHILATLLILALIGGLVYLFIPKEYELTITDLQWERSIDIEKYAWVDDSGWTLPSGAKLEYTREEIRTYREEFSHYETKTRQVVTGYRTEVTGYRDLGNGQFEEVTRQVPVYGTETYQEAVYKSVPVYDTKYYYEIQRWIHGRYVTTSGKGTEPYWGEVVLGKDERRGSSSERYTVKGTDEEGEAREFSMDLADYMKMEIGAIVKLKVTLGHAEIVLE